MGRLWREIATSFLGETWFRMPNEQNFIKKGAFCLFYLQIFWSQKIYDKKPVQWIKNNVRTALSKPFDEHYRQVVVYVIPLCVYWLKNK